MTTSARFPLAGLGLAVLLGLSGCGGGVTVEGRSSSLISPTPAPSVSHSPKLRTPTPAPTPTENRVAVPGPELAYRTPQGEALLRVVTYSWQQTKFGEKSAPPTHQYLVLDIEVSATTGVVEVLPINLSAATPAGPVEPTLGRDGNEPTLANKRLQAGESVRGFVVFDLPRGDVMLTVTDELGTKAGETKIPGA